MSARQAIATLLVGASLVLAAHRAHAEPGDVDEARRLFIEGAKLAQKGSWAEARDRYEQSLGHKRAPLTLYSLGVAQRATGLRVEALDSFRAFLAEQGTTATAGYLQPAKQAVDELEAEVGHLRVSLAGPAGPSASLELDGRLLSGAALLAPTVVNPGPHRLRASVPRWGEVTVDVVVAAGSTQEVTLRLVGPLAEPRPTAIAAPTPVATYPRALPYALLGAGAVTLAAGVAIGVVGVSQAEASPTRDGAEADAARTKALVGDVVGGVGIAAMAAGLGVLIFTPRSRRAPRATHLAPFVAGPSGGLLGTF